MSLELKALTVSYGPIAAVRSIDLKVEPGAVTTIIGSNGAGKTTIMKAVAGLLPQTKGEILFRGTDLARIPAHRVVAEGVALVPEGRRLFLSMTVRENLLIGAYRRNDVAGIRADLERVLDYLPAIRDKLTQRAGLLSGGQQQMLAVGRALMSRPRLLMLDEPSVGLAPAVVQRIGEIVTAVSRDGVDVLLVEQNAKLALDLAAYGYVLEMGQIVLHGKTAMLRGNAAVQQAYLGI